MPALSSRRYFASSTKRPHLPPALDRQQDVRPLREQAEAGGEARVVRQRDAPIGALEGDAVPPPAPQKEPDAAMLGAEKCRRRDGLPEQVGDGADNDEVGPQLVEEVQVFRRVRDRPLGEREAQVEHAARGMSVGVAGGTQQARGRDGRRDGRGGGEGVEPEEAGEAERRVVQVGEDAAAASGAGRVASSACSAARATRAAARRARSQRCSGVSSVNRGRRSGRTERTGTPPRSLCPAPPPRPCRTARRDGGVGPLHGLDADGRRRPAEVAVRAGGDLPERRLEIGERAAQERQPRRPARHPAGLDGERLRRPEILERESRECLVEVGPHPIYVRVRHLCREYVYLEGDLLHVADGYDEPALPDLSPEVYRPRHDAPLVLARQSPVTTGSRCLTSTGASLRLVTKRRYGVCSASRSAAPASTGSPSTTTCGAAPSRSTVTRRQPAEPSRPAARAARPTPAARGP